MVWKFSNGTLRPVTTRWPARPSPESSSAANCVAPAAQSSSRATTTSLQTAGAAAEVRGVDVPSMWTAGRIGGRSWPLVARGSIRRATKFEGGGGVAAAPSSETSTVAVRPDGAVEVVVADVHAVVAGPGSAEHARGLDVRLVDAGSGPVDEHRHQRRRREVGRAQDVEPQPARAAQDPGVQPALVAEARP